MHRYVWVAFLLCVFAKFTLGQGMSEGRLVVEERIFIASKVFSLLQSPFFGSSTAATPAALDSSYRNYLHIILSTDDRRQFDMATIEYVAQMHNGHTFFWDVWLEENHNQPLGFYAASIDGIWVVQTSFVGGLRPGDIISKIDDTAIEAFFLQQQRYISASSTAIRHHNLFLFPYLFPERFMLTLGDGRQVMVNRATLSKHPQNTEARWLSPGTIAYIRIPEFFDPSFEGRAVDCVRQFRHAKVLLVDVRGNPGGVSPGRLIEALMNRPYRGWKESSRQPPASCNTDEEATSCSGTHTKGDNSNATSIKKSELKLPKPDAYQGRLIFIVDGGCVSACEDLVEPSKESGRAILVGETTQGSSGVPLIYDFGNGMTLRIAAKRYLFPDGSEFEGIGIKPDIQVHTTIEDLKAGRDPVLERALELASNPGDLFNELR
jgi:carboxyl-terminal processing protease